LFLKERERKFCTKNSRLALGSDSRVRTGEHLVLTVVLDRVRPVRTTQSLGLMAQSTRSRMPVHLPHHFHPTAIAAAAVVSSSSGGTEVFVGNGANAQITQQVASYVNDGGGSAGRRDYLA
jgi:hypothetical protein